MLTIAEILKQVASLCKINASSSFVTNADPSIRQLVAIANSLAQTLPVEHDFPALRRKHTFALVEGQAAYALPEDFHKLVSDTVYDKSQNWFMAGPISPSRWTQDEVLGTGVTKQWQLAGYGELEFYILPVPSASEAGQEVLFRYYSKSCIRPRRWQPNTSYQVGTLVSSRELNYVAVNSGTSGATQPVHSVGSETDGGVSWQVNNSCICQFQADTDITVIPDSLFIAGVHYGYLYANGLPYDEEKARYRTHLAGALAGKQGGGTWSSNNGSYVEPWLQGNTFPFRVG